MKKLVLVLALCIGGCASIPNPLTPNRLAQAEAVYAVALSAAVTYYRLYRVNRCTVSRPLSATNYCASRSVVVALQNADRTAKVARKQAQDFVKTYPTLDAGAAVYAFEQSISAFQQVQYQNGVQSK